MFISRLFIISGVLFLTLIHSNQTLAEISTGTWALAAPAPTQRTEVAATAIEGRIYVVGGFNKPNSYSRSYTDTRKIKPFSGH